MPLTFSATKQYHSNSLISLNIHLREFMNHWEKKDHFPGFSLAKFSGSRFPTLSLFTTKCLGLLRLDRSCGNDRLELACDRALKLKAIGYRSLRNILD